jgi:hypothetical protein
MKNLSSLSVIAAALFAAISAGLWLSRPADHTPHVAELEQKLQQATAEIAKLKAMSARPKSIPAFGPERSPSISAVAGSGGPDKKNDGPREPSALAKMVSDPKMREAMKGAAVAQIEMQYSQLISKLSLDAAETSHFKKLLGDRLSAKTDLSFKMMDAALSKEQRKAATDEYNAKNKVSDAAIKQFLNDDTDFATFKHWEDTETERMQMMMGKSAFDGANATLAPEQEEQLINLMAEVRKRPSDVPDLNDPQNIDPSMMTDEFTRRAIAVFDQQQGSVLEGAAGFLTPPQLEALKKMQEQMRALNEAGLKMSKSMMGK